MTSRRQFLASTIAGSLAGPVLLSQLARAAAGDKMLRRPIPSSGELVPAIGMGTSGSFQVPAGSAEYQALKEVLKRFFGTDRIRFTTCSLTAPPGTTCSDASPAVRSYTSFSQAREENGASRIFVGFHFRKAVEEGITHGRKIGDRAVDRFLQPVR